MKFLGLIMATVFLLSCAHLNLERSEQAQVLTPEASDFQGMESSLQSQNYEKALGLSQDFIKKYPYSLKTQKARYYSAQALEELGRWTEAERTYKTISEFSEKNQPEISAMALYRLSFVYEALGDDQRVLTTLFEAQKYAAYLPAETVSAEIPSRLAMVYAKENNLTEAHKWIQEADRGLKKSLEGRSEPLTPQWLAKMFYNMGSISTQQISKDNIWTLIQGQKAIQKYLIRSMQYQDPVWSKRSLEKLQGTYVDLWKVLENYPEPSGYEPLVAQKLKKEEQIKLAVPFSELIEEAQLYRPGAEQKINPYQKEFFAFLDNMQGRTQKLLESSLYTPLMPGRDKAPQRPQSPVKIVPSEDPNLKM